jgi:hypothetical protein
MNLRGKFQIKIRKTVDLHTPTESWKKENAVETALAFFDFVANRCKEKISKEENEREIFHLVSPSHKKASVDPSSSLSSSLRTFKDFFIKSKTLKI